MQCNYGPKQFDVIVTDNLFGDILSDEAAMHWISWLVASASLGAKDKMEILDQCMNQYGSAPDIAKVLQIP